MGDAATFYSLHNLIGHRQHSSPCKARCQYRAAVDASHFVIFRITAKLQCLFNNRCKIFIWSDMHHFRIRNHFGGENTIAVGILDWHQTVGRVENGRWYTVKFLLLILPCGTKVSLKVRVSLKLGICMGGQHFTVSINVDSLVLCLFQKQIKIMQVMACDDDKWPLLNGHGNLCGLRCPVGFCVGFIQHGHTLQIDIASIHDQRQQRVHILFTANGAQRSQEKSVDILIVIPQYIGVIGVGCHTAQTKQDQRF